MAETMTGDVATMWAAVREDWRDVLAWNALADALMDGGQHYAAGKAREVAGALLFIPTGPMVLGPVSAARIKKAMGNRKRGSVSLRMSFSPVELFGDWRDGGSRNAYATFTMNGGAVRHLHGGGAPFSGTPINRHTVEAGRPLVQHGTFCGKPASLRVVCHPFDVLELLK
jgi:hypothetical protein